MESVAERFIRYAKIDTESNPDSETTPSTLKQFNLLNLLEEEMEEMGVSDVFLSDKGYLYGTIAATSTKKLPKIGFIAHVDTSPDMSGEGVNPQIVKYSGGDLVLNREKTIVTPISQFPELESYIGHTLITTDGTTLLGADDKAGVAEIMCAANHLICHPEIEHGEVKIAFTVDEEIGRGADFFDVELFGADFAYTMDGSSLGEIEYENFNAAKAEVEFSGRNVHPGYAKNKMINSLELAVEFDTLIPATQRPQYTEGYEGFYHLYSISGSVENAKAQYIIRDHDSQLFSQKKEYMQSVAALMAQKYGAQTINLEITEQYRNMREVIENGNMEVVERAVKAMEKIGITPKVKAIRGGTDGSRLSFMGLPCPNLFAGGENFHGKHEFVSIEVLNRACDLIIAIVDER